MKAFNNKRIKVVMIVFVAVIMGLAVGNEVAGLGNGIKVTSVNGPLSGGNCKSAASLGSSSYARVDIADSGNVRTHIVWNIFRSDTAGCAPTNEKPASGGSTRGDCNFDAPHQSGKCFLEYNVSSRNCGRVQYDAAFSDGGGIFLGAVIDYGNDCGGPPPTPRPTATPPPTAPGSLTAQCTGGLNPQVVLNWTSGTNPTSNSIQKGDLFPTDSSAFWGFILQDPSLSVRTFTDTNVSIGDTWSYRVKYSTTQVSNTVNITLTPEVCGVQPTPMPTPTPTPTPTPIPGILTGQCTNDGESNIAIDLQWTSGTNPQFYRLRRGDATPNDPSTFWTVILDDPTATIQNYSDPVNIGETWSYSVRYAPGVVSNTVKIDVDYESCGLEPPATPTPTPTPTPTATPTPTITPTPTVTPVPTPTITPTPTPILPVIEEPEYIISKYVRNVSRGEQNFIPSTEGSPLEIVEFSIWVTGINDTVKDVYLYDILPSDLIYLTGSVVLDGVVITNNSLVDGQGLFLGNISEGQRRIITFRAQIADPSRFNLSRTILINLVRAVPSNAPTKEATAEVIVTKMQPGEIVTGILDNIKNIFTGSIGYYFPLPAEDDEIAENYIYIPKTKTFAPLNTPPNSTDSIYESLRQGVALYPESANPGEEGNTVILGHSSDFPWAGNKYHDVFAYLEELQDGDEIEINSNGQRYRYKVSKSEILSVFEANNVANIKSEKSNKLLLMSCWPVGSAQKRIVITAEPL